MADLSLRHSGAKLTENSVASHFSCPQELIKASQECSDRQSIILSDGKVWLLVIQQFLSENIVRLAVSKAIPGKTECSQVERTKGSLNRI